MAKKLNIGEMLGAAVSNSDTMQVRDIALEQLDENPANSYSQTGIDALAESIQVVGLQQPLVVTAEPNGRYMLLAGHRRRNALALLGRKTAPCAVLDSTIDPSLRTLILHWTNTMARGGAGLTCDGVSAAAKEIESALTDLKARGVVELPGKLREYVAGVLDVSETKLANAKQIESHLIPKLLKKYKNHDVNDAVALELSRCPEGLQEKLYDAYAKPGYLFNLDAKKVKAHDKADAAGFAPLICPAHQYGGIAPCVGTDKRAAAVKRGECPGCCHDCDKADGCQWVCGTVSKRIDAEKSAEDQKRAADEKLEVFRKSTLGSVYARVRSALEQAGCSVNAALPGMAVWDTNMFFMDNPTRYGSPSIATMQKIADALGIDLQELMFGNQTTEGEALRHLENQMQDALVEVHDA